MKRIILLFLTAVMLMVFTTMSAQQQIKGTLEAGLGIGLLPTFPKDKGIMTVPPLSLNLDYRFGGSFSLGLYLGYSVTETDKKVLSDGQIAQWQNRFTNFGIRAAAHTRNLKNWDVYGGMTFGYNLSRIKIMEGKKDAIINHMGIKPVSGKFSATGFVGARHAIGKKIGIYGEMGFGVSLFNIGLSLKLK